MKKKMKLDEINVESFVTDVKTGQGGVLFPTFNRFCFDTQHVSCVIHCQVTLYPDVCF